MQINFLRKGIFVFIVWLVANLGVSCSALTTQELFKQYKADRPDTNYFTIGSSNMDRTLKSIAKIYGITIDLFDKYSVRIENSKVALIGEEIRKEKGDEAFKEYVASLKGKDKEEYEKFLNNEINSLEVVPAYLTEAFKLQASIGGVDIKSLLSNPFKIPKALKGTNHGKDQILYTIKTLKWLKSTRDAYKAALNYKGR